VRTSEIEREYACRIVNVSVSLWEKSRENYLSWSSHIHTGCCGNRCWLWKSGKSHCVL